MKFPEKVNFNDFIGHHTLIYGETDTKKTYYTANLVQFLVEIEKINPKEISILDFAPKLKIINNLKIGGKVQDFYKNSIVCNNILFEGEIVPARLKATNKKDLYDNACKNFKKTSKILTIFNSNPTSILIINDISIYLHLGNKNFLLKTIEKVNTFFGNTYYGESISRNFATLFSLNERRKVEFLIKRIEKSYLLD